jgi:hypothetical protein|tara:strand:+ start:99 stop:404 length:306 start_codon:yes stop_codon:yes gene_type:complete
MAVVGIIVLLFSISNRDLILIEFWPLSFVFESPVYFPALTFGLVGFLSGGTIAWLSAGTNRKNARKAKRRASSLEKDLTTLQSKIEKLEKEKKAQNTGGNN